MRSPTTWRSIRDHLPDRSYGDPEFEFRSIYNSFENRGFNFRLLVLWSPMFESGATRIEHSVIPLFLISFALNLAEFTIPNMVCLAPSEFLYAGSHLPWILRSSPYRIWFALPLLSSCMPNLICLESCGVHHTEYGLPCPFWVLVCRISFASNLPEFTRLNMVWHGPYEFFHAGSHLPKILRSSLDWIWFALTLLSSSMPDLICLESSGVH
jgi:hypothetical protein